MCLPKEDAKQLTQVHVVWSLFKAQATAVVQIHCKLCRKSLGTCNNTVELSKDMKNSKQFSYKTCSYLTEDLNRGGHLLLWNLFILLLLCGSLQRKYRKITTINEVNPVKLTTGIDSLFLLNGSYAAFGIAVNQHYFSITIIIFIYFGHILCLFFAYLH